MSGADVKPHVIENYDGKDIRLNAGVTMKVADFPELSFFKGHTLIHTDGTTLLGADDKAGVAEIMTAAEYLLAHPELRHGKIRIGFTPDEEIGRGVDFFDVKASAPTSPTRWTAASRGNSNTRTSRRERQDRDPGPQRPPGLRQRQDDQRHSGSMRAERPTAGLGATRTHRRLRRLLPLYRPQRYGRSGADQLHRPATTTAPVSEARKNYMQECVDLLVRKYGEGVLTLTLKDSYYNMRKMVEPHPQVIDKAIEAMKMAGVEPLVKPIRGGTDGARLSFMGLPCPNIFTGGMNFHGRYEYCSLTTMHKAMQVILNLAQLWTK